ERGVFLRRYGVSIILCAVGFALAAGPLGAYALIHPQEFNGRTAQLSVMPELEAAHSIEPLVNNVKTHLLMFNVHGDPNGRHNWTGRPMLSPIVGAAAVLGLALAFFRIRRWQY